VLLRSRIGVPMILACTAPLAACSSTTGNTGPSSATLVVTVSTPPGILGNVTVTGPGAYTKTLTATDTLRGLSAGSYTVSAVSATIADSLVSAKIAATISNSPVAVSAGHTTSVNAYYFVQPGSGALWIGWGFANQVATGLTSSQLAAAGRQLPADTIGGAGSTSNDITGSAFDAAGNLWVANSTLGLIEEFTAEQLASGVSTPAVTVSFTDAPWGLTFDASNNLWVSFYTANHIEEFSVAQVDGFRTTVSSPTPQVTLTSLGATGLAFDKNGALWVAGFADSTIYAFAPNALASGGSAPSVSITSTALKGVAGVTFDASGNLWAATEGGLLVSYSAAQLVATTPPSAPTRTLAASNPTYRFDQTAFDNSGNLWAGTLSADVIEYSPAQLAAGGSPTPARTLTIPNEGVLAVTHTITFDPHPTGVPIAGLRVHRPGH
jgi:hypothetical protein